MVEEGISRLRTRSVLMEKARYCVDVHCISDREEWQRSKYSYSANIHTFHYLWRIGLLLTSWAYREYDILDDLSDKPVLSFRSNFGTRRNRRWVTNEEKTRRHTCLLHSSQARSLSSLRLPSMTPSAMEDGKRFLETSTKIETDLPVLRILHYW